MGDGSGEHRWDPNGTDYRFTDLAACFITLTRSDASQDKVVEIRPKGGGAAVVKMPPFASGAKEYKIDGNDYAAKLADDTEYYLYVGDDRAFAFEKRTSRWRFAVTPKVAGAYSFDGSAAYFVPAITAGVGFVTKRGDEGSAISLRAVFGAGPNLINGSKQQTNAATGQPETVPDTSKPIQFLIGGEVVLARYLSIGYAAVAGKNRPDTGVLLFSYGDLYPAPLNAGQ